MHYYGIVDLIRLGYFDSDQGIRDRIRAKRLPPPIKIGGKLKWKAHVIDEWMEKGSIKWFPRTRQS